MLFFFVIFLFSRAPNAVGAGHHIDRGYIDVGNYPSLYTDPLETRILWQSLFNVTGDFASCISGIETNTLATNTSVQHKLDTFSWRVSFRSPRDPRAEHGKCLAQMQNNQNTHGPWTRALRYATLPLAHVDTPWRAWGGLHIEHIQDPCRWRMRHLVKHTKRGEVREMTRAIVKEWAYLFPARRASIHANSTFTWIADRVNRTMLASGNMTTGVVNALDAVYTCTGRLERIDAYVRIDLQRGKRVDKQGAVIADIAAAIHDVVFEAGGRARANVDKAHKKLRMDIKRQIAKTLRAYVLSGHLGRRFGSPNACLFRGTAWMHSANIMANTLYFMSETSFVVPVLTNGTDDTCVMDTGTQLKRSERWSLVTQMMRRLNVTSWPRGASEFLAHVYHFSTSTALMPYNASSARWNPASGVVEYHISMEKMLPRIRKVSGHSPHVSMSEYDPRDGTYRGLDKQMYWRGVTSIAVDANSRVVLCMQHRKHTSPLETAKYQLALLGADFIDADGRPQTERAIRFGMDLLHVFADKLVNDVKRKFDKPAISDAPSSIK